MYIVYMYMYSVHVLMRDEKEGSVYVISIAHALVEVAVQILSNDQKTDNTQHFDIFSLPQV